MARRHAAVFLLSLLVVAFLATSVAIGAEKPEKPRHQRAFLPARLAPVYGFAGMEEGISTPIDSHTGEIPLSADKSRYSGVQVGTTTYGYQSNCTMGRQVEHRNTGAVFMDWMYQDHDTLGVGRKIKYQKYDEAVCDFEFEQGGIFADEIYSGYCDIDVAPDKWAIPTAHELADGEWYAKAFWDFKVVPGLFQGDNPTDRFGHYQNNGTGPDNENIWPIIEFQAHAPGEAVTHMVCCETGGEAGDPQTISYYRRVGPYEYQAGVWSDQRLIDTVMNINVTIAASRTTGKVAIVWNAPAAYKQDTDDEYSNQLENDIFYAVTADYGAAWASVSPGPSIAQVQGINITQYTVESDWKAYCDISTVMESDLDETVHIVWGCRRWTDTSAVYRRQSAIFHWKEGDPIPSSGRTVVKALWDSGGACYGHAWGSDVAKMSITECDDKMYCLFTQFGSAQYPCHDIDADNQVVNGYLYMSVYDPFYDAWDRGQRVTNTNETPQGCIPGDMSGPGTCNSEYWSTMARIGRLDSCETQGMVLDVMYINDFAPGGCVQTESGVWTVNDVVWQTYPCREAVPEPIYGDNAGTGYGICNNSPILVVPPGEDTTLSMTVENSGLVNLVLSDISVTQNDPNVTITTIPDAPPDITIAPGGGTQDIDILISVGVGATDPSTVEDVITITHNAEGNPREIPICVTITTTYVPLESADLATSCKRIRVYNDGGLSNDAANASLDFIDEEDCATLYLYDGSPIICRDVGGETVCFFSCFDHNFARDNTLRQISPMYVDSINNESYTYATAEMITADSAIGLIVEYFVPKHEDSCCFIIEKLKIFNRTGELLSAVAAGEMLDWDIPSFESASNNESGKDEPRQLIYQTCYDENNCPDNRDPCDTTKACARNGGIAASAEQSFKNYMTVENDVWVYTTGPYGDAAPFPGPETYDLMTNPDNDGFHLATVDSICEDLTTLVTFGVYDIAPEDTICVVKILSTTRDDPGAAILSNNIDKANAFIEEHPEIKCAMGPGPCECLPADANNDGGHNVADAVYIINYVFKNGPPPIPYEVCSGDTQPDCGVNVADAVYLINYVFKNGPPPTSCEDWRATCGDY